MTNDSEQFRNAAAAEQQQPQPTTTGELRIGDLAEKQDSKEQDDALRGGVIRGETDSAAEPKTYITEW